MAAISPAFQAAGIIGTWDTDVPAALSVLDEGAAQLLAGNIELAGRPIPLEVALGRTHPDDRDWVFGRIRRARRTGGAISSEFRIVTETGEVRWILNRGYLAPDAHGLMRGRGAYIDTTDSHRGPFLVVGADHPAEPDPLIEAVDRCIDAHKAVGRVGQESLIRLSELMLFEIGRTLARRTHA